MIALNFGARFFAILLIFFVAVATFYFHDFWNQAPPDNAKTLIDALEEPVAHRRAVHHRRLRARAALGRTGLRGRLAVATGAKACPRLDRGGPLRVKKARPARPIYCAWGCFRDFVSWPRNAPPSPHLATAPPWRDADFIRGVQHLRFAGFNPCDANTCCGVRGPTPGKQGSPPGSRTCGASDSQNVS